MGRIALTPSTKMTQTVAHAPWAACLREKASERGLRGYFMTKVDIVTRVGKSQSYLCDVEYGGKEVAAEVLLAISREFGKSLDGMLTRGRE
jgi:hypothetical protein